MPITLPADGWVLFFGGDEPGASIAWTLFLYLGYSDEAKLHRMLQDECESLLD